MPRKQHGNSRRWKGSRRSVRHCGHVDRLENRQLLAAHIVGDPSVYATIQAAVNAAAPRAIINVDAGTYSERVTINKSLTLRGAQAGIDARSNVRQSGANETIFNGIALGGTSGQSNSFYIAANDVTIDGFTVQGNTNTSTATGAGIVIAPKMSGTHLFNNIVQNNVAGLFLANFSTTDPAIIQFNLFRKNNNPGADGGRGIYTDGGISGGNVTNVIIDSNFFYDNHGSTGTTGLEGAIALESRTLNSQSNFTITNNAFDADGKAVLAYNATHLLIQGNVATFTRDYFSGVLRFEGGMSNVTIKGNTIYRNPGPAIRIDEKAFNGSNFGFVITNNNIYGGDYNYGTHRGLIVAALQYDGQTLDATNNWWGDPSGPSGDGPGTGDGVQANGAPVTFTPWATSPTTNLDTPYSGAPLSLSATIQAEDFDSGGEGNGDHNNATTNLGGEYRYSANVGIDNTTDAGGGFYVGWTNAAEWLKYTVNASTAGLYKVDFRVANGQGTAGTFHLEVDGTNVTGPITVAPTGGWQNWTTLSASGISLSAGQHLLRLVMDTVGNGGSVANFNWMKFTNTAPAPVPAAPSNLTAAVNGANVNLSWTDNSTNESGFIIERQTGPTGVWQPIVTTGSAVTAYTDAGLAAATTYTYRVRATNSAGDSANSNTASVTTPALSAATYLSDLPFAGTPINGWGPVERDMSNGGSNAGDGNTLTLNGVTYAKGLGVHAISDVAFNLGGGYTQFLSDVGIDDEEAAGGSVIFQVFADGTKIFDSGVMSATSDTQHVSLSVAGVQQLRLHVDDAGDGVDFDHADWAGARLSTAAPTSKLAAPTKLTASAVGSNQIKLAWTDNGTNESGFLIERSTDGITFTQVATVAGNLTNYTDNGVLAGKTYTYRARATLNGTNSDYSNTAATTTVALPAQVYLSDLTWTSATVGYGTIQKDLSIKGNPITLRGKIYPKGIGTHAVSNIVYTLNGQYSSFISDLGVDDEVNGQGSVDFQVIADGNLLFDSGPLTGTSPVINVNLPMTGVQQLTLVATNGIPNSIDFDHADWAGAILTAANTAPAVVAAAVKTVSASPLPVTPTNLKAVALAPTQVKLTWNDNSSNETGFLVERKTATGAWVQIATTKANVRTFTDKTAKAGKSYAYRVRAVNKAGKSAYSNVVNIKTPLVSTVLAPPTTLF